MFTYWNPCAASPDLSNPSAAARTRASLTVVPQQFQEFQPSGGVSASACAAPTITNGRDASPLAFLTWIVTAAAMGDFSDPVMMPAAGSSLRPAGRLSTL